MGKKNCIIFLEWIDAESEVGWDDVDHFSSDLNTVFTVGFLVYEDKQKYVVATSYDPINEHYNCVIKIPRAWVVKKRILKNVRL